ncbi:hypothetical protein [Acidithiobacillus thiooxidans]|nr:hypothetical protein [Acidithiobacillus thiooxidans]
MQDMANLMDAMDALTDLPWFPICRLSETVRAFRVEHLGIKK